MRNILLLFSIIILISSCDNWKDPYYGLDDTPVLTVQKLTDTISRTTLIDSMKMGKPYVFKYNIVSFENLPLNILKTPLSDSVIINPSVVNVTSPLPGISTMQLKVQDPFGKSASAKVEITFFTNLPPVCLFTVKQTGAVNPFEIDINASTSYDQDARWGGQVVNYRYIVGSKYDKQSALNDIQYVCEGPGEVKITVMCQDNDGAWSQPNTIFFSVADTTN
jgi:hypothetical protein